MITAVALVTADASGRVLPGVVGYLRSPELPNGFLFGITNLDGYVVFNNVPTPFTGTLQLAGAAAYYQQPVSVSGENVTIRVGPSPSNPQDVHLPACTSFKQPFRAAPRFWKANMCGTRVEGIEPVAGGAGDASLVLSWFYDRYTATSREKIRAAWQAKGLTHVLLSWPDSRAVGQSVEQFKATCQELITAGFFPCVFLSSKDHDPHDASTVFVGLQPVLDALVGIVPMFCVGWELSLWLSPTDVQTLIDGMASRLLKQPGTRLYVHFQEGYSSFQQPDHFFADFWNLNVGKLTGVLHQKVLSQTPAEYRGESGGLIDVLQRFAGNFGVSPDSGFGHPFDCVACEITAMPQFNGTVREDAGNALGRWAIETPAQIGPAGMVGVMGSGNGL